jgi:hypothetical protein
MRRDLLNRSLQRWADDDLVTLPTRCPFPETELKGFCVWLEDKGLFRYYWHFRQPVELERRDDHAHRAAWTSEVVGFATLSEMIVNEVMIDRRLVPRGATLFPKVPPCSKTAQGVRCGRTR